MDWCAARGRGRTRRLAISGGVQSNKRGSDYLQEDDPVALFRDVAVYSEIVASPEQAAAVLHQAIAEAYGKRGVAHISIPPDVFSASTSDSVPSLATLRPRSEVAPAIGDIAEAAKLVAAARSVAVLCGFGCHGAPTELIAISDRLRAPLIHTYRGKDILSYDDPHWIGGIGLIGGRPGVDALAHADLILMLGTDYPYSEFLPKNKKVVQIDERAFALGRRTEVTLGVTGSVRPALQMLLDKLPQRTNRSFFDNTNEDRAKWDKMLDEKAALDRSTDRLHPQAVARAISDRAASDAIWVTDTGEVTLWAANWFRQTGKQKITGSFNNAAVGTGLGIANGVQALDRARQVILHIGDGGFTMLLGEFMTAVEHKLPIKVVVYDNGGWGMVHLEMESAGLSPAAGAAFPNLDFAAFAKACGAKGFYAKKAVELPGVIDAWLATNGPAILHAVVDPDEIPTMPHIEIGQVARFGISKVKQTINIMVGRR